MMELILIRGLPGSGKSTFTLKMHRPNDIILEADLYFMDAEGNYNFNREGLYAAHNWCQRATRMYLGIGNRVLVANTFTTVKELKPYFEIAKEFGIVPTVIHCQNQFQNIHDVPTETLVKMKERWCDDLSSLFEMLENSDE